MEKKGHALFFTVAKSSTPTVFLFKSHPIAVGGGGTLLEWDPLEKIILENICLFSNSDLPVITCHLADPCIPWFRIQLCYLQLAFADTIVVEHELGYGAFTLKTRAFNKRHAKGQGFFSCADFKLYHVSLAYSEQALEEFVRKESTFRVVASIQVREWNDAKQMIQHVHYMGRAQNISTTSERTRTYTWTSKTQESAFPGVRLLVNESDWEQQTRDHHIKMQLNIKIPSDQDTVYTSALTTRNRRNSLTVGDPDNDAFSNPARLLPIPVKHGQYFTLKIFNLLLLEQYCPSIEVSMRTAGVNATTTEITADMRVHTKYDETNLTEISLVVKNYQSALSDLKSSERLPLTI